MSDVTVTKQLSYVPTQKGQSFMYRRHMSTEFKISQRCTTMKHSEKGTQVNDGT